jgi:DNA-binding response OmpR family regulator
MILLITSSARAAECAAALRQSSGEAVEWASDLPRASSALRAQEFSTVIFDDSMLELDPEAEDFLLPQCGSATPIHVNSADKIE